MSQADEKRHAGYVARLALAGIVFLPVPSGNRYVVARNAEMWTLDADQLPMFVEMITPRVPSSRF